MTGGQHDGDLHSWRQLSLVGPTVIRISSVVWLDGLRGEAQYSTLVSHGVERLWVACCVVPGVPLAAVASVASADLKSSVASSLNCLSPF